LRHKGPDAWRLRSTAIEWIVSVRPAPTKRYQPTPVEELAGAEAPTLGEFGLVDGSTLIFARSAKPEPKTA